MPLNPPLKVEPLPDANQGTVTILDEVLSTPPRADSHHRIVSHWVTPESVSLCTETPATPTVRAVDPSHTLALEEALDRATRAETLVASLSGGLRRLANEIQLYANEGESDST